MLLLIGSNPQQGDAPLVGILVEHVERQRIVDIVTHVGIENHLHGVSSDTAPEQPVPKAAHKATTPAKYFRFLSI